MRREDRIKLFRGSDHKWEEQVELFHAAKLIGNLATHETVTRDEVLDAFEMLEAVIEDVFVGTRRNILAKARERNHKHRKSKTAD